MTKQKEFFSLNVPLQLPEQWMMGVTCLEVYNTVYNITDINNKLEIHLTGQQLKEHGIETEVVPNTNEVYETADNKIVEKTNTIITNSKNPKLTRRKINDLKEIIEVFTYTDQQINMASFDIENDSFGMEISPEVYEIIDINRTKRLI